MSVELYFSPYCRGCGAAERPQTGSGAVHWIDATTHLEAAAGLRITRLPALVVEGRLVAQGPVALRKLHDWLATQSGGVP